MSLAAKDKIQVVDLQVRARVGVDRWERDKVQPILLSVTVYPQLPPGHLNDDLDYSIDYGKLAKCIEKLVKAMSANEQCTSLANFGRYLVLGINREMGLPNIKMLVTKPHASRFAKSISATVFLLQNTSDLYSYASPFLLQAAPHWNMAPSSKVLSIWTLAINELSVFTIIGMNDFERRDVQPLSLSLDILIDSAGNADGGASYPTTESERNITIQIRKFAEASSFLTVEAFASGLMIHLFETCRLLAVRLSVSKPSAITFASAAKVTIFRDAHWYASQKSALVAKQCSDIKIDQAVQPFARKCYLAIGTNIGHRVANIKQAIRLLLNDSQVTVQSTSFLYRTKPMYLEDQADFLNCAVEVRRHGSWILDMNQADTSS